LLRTYLLGVLAAWAVQFGFVLYFLVNLTWQNYWFCRALYRPGLILFAALFRGILPSHYFSAFNRTGVISGFAFATLVYALVLVTACMLFAWFVSKRRRRLLPVRVRLKVSRA
jgi:hypothetical protein